MDSTEASPAEPAAIDGSPLYGTFGLNPMPLTSRGTVPSELQSLLQTRDDATREAAWETLIAAHTRLLMAIARARGGDHDAAMDRYSYVLEKLRESDFQRLRSFRPDGGASFSTWLTVTARRLCLDHYRAKYGRHRTESDAANTESLRAVRRALNDSESADVEPDLIPDSASPSPDTQAWQIERNALLRDALGTLTPQEQLLLTLRFEDDLSAARIARALGLPTPFHVYRQVSAVTAKLRNYLERRGMESSDG